MNQSRPYEVPPSSVNQFKHFTEHHKASQKRTSQISSYQLRSLLAISSLLQRHHRETTKCSCIFRASLLNLDAHFAKRNFAFWFFENIFKEIQPFCSTSPAWSTFVFNPSRTLLPSGHTYRNKEKKQKHWNWASNSTHDRDLIASFEYYHLLPIDNT